MDAPKPGQRWNSTSEPELGLGLVIEADSSFVRLLFPATGEMRNYAWGAAPLSRFVLSVGETVTDQEGHQWVVEHIREQEGIRVYYGAGNELPESSLDDRMASQSPLDRFARGEYDSAESFERRLQLWTKRQEIDSNSAKGFFGGRIELLPHQLRLVEEVSGRLRPRVLLADEVGLGKTIEACMLLHHGIRTGRLQRILILVPDALLHQWFVELLRRFLLSFSIVDRDRLDRAEENPFFEQQWCLSSLEVLAGHPEGAAWALPAEWDMVVVDEAHHLKWHPDQEPPAFRLMKGLAQAADGLLLLSATPAQLGEESYFAQLHLLDPDRYNSFPEFVQEQDTYKEVADRAERLKSQGHQEEFAQLLLCHGPGRILFRNTRDHVQGFPSRCVHPYLIKGEKAEWLREFLHHEPEKKVLVITRSPEEVKQLATLVQTYLEPAPVLFHEEQDILVRDRQAAWFADPAGSRVMIASDIGGEGRNFQFVQHLVFFDIPRNTERIEQRIGRLDRIGQQQDIHLHLPVVQESEEASWMRWVHEGLGAFEHPRTCGPACVRIFQDRLGHIDEPLLQETRETVAKLEQEYRQGAQRLITWKHELEQPESEMFRRLRLSDDDPSLLPFAEDLWQSLGLELDPLQTQEYLLKPGMFFQGELPVPDEGIRFTSDRRTALAREELEFLTWDHPLLLEAWEASLRSSSGSMSLAHSGDINLPCIEVLFLLEPVAPAELHLSRFLPPTPLRVCVDAQGAETDLPGTLSEATGLPDILQHPRFLKEWIPERLSDANARVKKRAAANVAAARQEAEEKLGKEIQRLKELHRINDHVRTEELLHLQQQRSRILEAIDLTEVRLDSVRVIVP